MRPRYAVITTRNRPEQFAACYAAIQPQVDHVITVLHRQEDYTGYASDLPGAWSSVIYLEDPPNISRMWNLGLTEAELGSYAWPHDVAILNDDAIVPPDWFDKISAEMQSAQAAAGASSPDECYHFLDDPEPPLPRMPGFAFILAGEWGLRLDEQFQWWWGDTDLDWRARQLSSVVLVPGIPVDHPPNGGGSTTGVLAEIAAADRDRFIAKWGAAPW